jgi:hypothetical protein
MSITTLQSSIKEIKNAVQELKSQSKGLSPELIIYFASPKYNPELLAAEMKQEFPISQSLGCTTSGEIVTGKMLDESIVAMAFEHELDDFQIQIVENISTRNQMPAVFNKFEKHFKESLLTLDQEKYVGIILIDGLSKAEERIMDQIGDLSSIPFIGGSAGDDLAFEQTFVFANGNAYTDAAILAVLKPTHGFDIIKTQSFSNMGIELEATKVQEVDRKVIEFNHKPAVQAYADALGIPAEKASEQFMQHPLGLMIGDEPYVRSPQQVEKGKIVFYCSILQGMKLSLLNSTDIIKDTKKALQEKEAKIGKIRGILNFNCILRSLELKDKKLTGPYGDIFSKIPTVGFSTYGEEFIGHINQTATMLVFK